MKFTHKKLSIVLTVMLVPTFFSGATLLASSLEVYHRTGEVMIDGQPYKRFDENNTVELEMAVGNTYYVKIMDNNPFLFTYDSKVITKDSKNYLLFKEYMDAFKDMTKLYSNKGKMNEIESHIETINNVSVNIERCLDERKGIIDATIISNDNLQKAREGVSENWSLTKWGKKLTVAYAALRKFISSETIEKSGNEKMVSLSKRLRFLDMQLEENKNEPDAAIKKETKKILDDERIKVMEEFMVVKAEIKNDPVLQRNAIALLAQEDVLKNTLSELIEFEKMLGKVNNGRPFKGNIDGRDTRKQKIDTITIAANPHFYDLLSENAKKSQSAHIGERKIIFNPKSYVEFRKAIGAVYSFVDNPKYEVVKDGNGNSIISQSSSDYKAFGGALMLNIIPTFMYGSTFEPFMQLGASADSDSVGGLLGGGVSFFPYPDGNGNLVSSFMLSAGIIYQQVDELANGLHVGDSLTTSSAVTTGSRTATVTTHSDIETDTKWDAGMYLMFGVNF